MNIQTLDSLWDKLSEKCAEALRMAEAETARFRANRVARLIGLLPYIAGCDDPERTALAHLAVFVVANRGRARGVFDHGPADDAEPLARLRTIADFKGGDAATLERGMTLLGLCMLAGYRRDMELDKLLGGYNPAASAPSSFAAAELRFKKTIESGTASLPDAILPAEEALKGYWQA